MTYFLVTIDTEEEREWGADYENHTNYTVENIKFLVPLQKIFDKHGVKPTYLIDYPVAINKKAVSILKKFQRDCGAEIGAHPHPWVNPPYEEKSDIKNTFIHNLPVELQLKKIKLLTDTIADNFGEKPVSYRAGRYGFNHSTVRILEELKYKIDSSIVPFRYAKSYYEPHFGYMDSIEPYFLDYSDVMKAGSSSILEVPLTVQFNSDVPEIFKKYYHRLPNIGIRRILSRVFNIDIFWLRPSYTSLKNLIALSKYLISRKVTFLNMMFHSNELMPKGSKYNICEEDVKRYLTTLDDYFTFVNENFLIEYVTLEQMYQLYI